MDREPGKKLLKAEIGQLSDEGKMAKHLARLDERELKKEIGKLYAWKGAAGFRLKTLEKRAMSILTEYQLQRSFRYNLSQFFKCFRIVLELRVH